MTLSGLSGSAFGSGVCALRAQVLHNVTMVECPLTDGLAAQNGHADRCRAGQNSWWASRPLRLV